MTKFKFGAYPKPWEIALSKGLNLLLPPAQIGSIGYMVFLMCASPVFWSGVGIMAAITLSIQLCYNNVKALLGRVTDDKSGE